jgi:hypothetical protein
MKIEILYPIDINQIAQVRHVVALPLNAVNPNGPQQLYGMPTKKQYIVFINQLGTAAPVVAQTYENTVGKVVWSRNIAGEYDITLAGAFPVAKTLCRAFAVSQATPILLGIGVVTDNDVVRLVTSDGTNVADSVIADGAVIEITVYP